MREVERIENVVLGGGESGKYIAWYLAQQGHPVVVVERNLIGGSCPNIACLPSKNVIRSAKVAELVRNATAYGVRTSDVAVEMAGVRWRKRDMVDGMIAIHRKKFAIPNLEFLLGEGRLVEPHTVEVQIAGGERRRFVADRLFLNLGTHAAIPGIPGLAEAAPLTHVEALELDRLPSHLVVIGGGYVGVELAQAFSRFGSEVTIVESGTQLLGREDPEVADAVSSIFAEDGIDVIVGARTESVSGRSGKRVSIRVTCARAIGETRGFMKILLDDTDDRILGFTMLGAEGGEVLAVVQTAMLGNMPYTTLRDAAILTHPTMAEGLNVLLSTVPK